ncbi:MAG TPA: transposase [Anaerolineae bacterium]|nr:transposase [Anaerolineae bacterium]
MLQSNQILQFAQLLFDSEDAAQHATPILKAILDGRSARVSAIAQHMRGSAAANYKHIQRFLQTVDTKESLLRLFQVDAPFVIGDATEIPRPHAYRTPYVGTLKDGKTRGFWLLLLATPYRGRALPCHFITYSSRTLAAEAESRNLNHLHAFQPLKALLGDKPLVLDRDFSYLELLEALRAAQINFVIRLKVGAQPPQFFDENKQRIELRVDPGKTAVYRGILYKGKVRVNVIGYWQPGYAEPLWVMTNLKAELAGQIYFARMKIEETFRDLKNLLGLEKVMNQQQAKMEQIVALVLLAFTLGVLVGEELRDGLYGAPSARHTDAKDAAQPPRRLHAPSQKWKLYSGLFILLKQKLSLAQEEVNLIVRTALDRFRRLVQHPVRTFV